MNIEYKNGKPFFEDCSLEEIIKLNRTPFYIYSQSSLENTYSKLKKDLDAEIFYAIKANSNQAILKLIKNFGSGADVVSVGELKRSLLAGFSEKKIIFEGVGKSKRDLEFAIDKNIRLINIESFDEIDLINEIGKEYNKVVDVGIRLNPDIDGNTLDKISTGKKTDKFGIEINKVNQLLIKFRELKNINLKGLSCHVGSQINNLKIFEKVFKTMKEVTNFFISNNIPIQHVDLGGGFPVNYDKDSVDMNISQIGELANLMFRNMPYEISYEPGRYLVAKSGKIITKIMTTKNNGGINYLITDAGMQTLIRPAMYASYHRIDSMNIIDKKKIKYTIAGPICETGDTLAKNIFLPEQKLGDYLIIHDTGAYGAVMASNYNSRGIPAEILVHKNQFATIREEEEILEIAKKDIIPDWIKSY